MFERAMNVFTKSTQLSPDKLRAITISNVKIYNRSCPDGSYQSFSV